MIHLLRLLILVASLLVLAGCETSGKTDQKAVLEVLQVRAQALNERDINRYLSVISQSYKDKGKDLNQLKSGLESGFKQYQSVDYRADEQTITIRGKQAEVNASYRMRVSIRGQKLMLDGKEHLSLTREPGGWKIVAGL